LHFSQISYRRKLGDFPRIGVLLSGGLDSSIVAKEATQVAEYVHGLRWTWQSLPLFHDEKDCAERIADALGIGLLTLNAAHLLLQAVITFVVCRAFLLLS